MIKILKEKTAGLLSKKNRTKYIVIMLIAALAMIVFTELPVSGKKEKNEPETREIEDYVHLTEERVESLLKNIAGVGSVKVMITFESSEINKYAIERNKSVNNAEKSGGEKETRTEINEKYIIVDNNGTEEALTECRMLPKVCGVVVVCDGGGNTAVRERVVSAVKTALNIGSDKVYVTEKK